MGQRRLSLLDVIMRIKQNLKAYVDMTNASEIARRYFVTNAFDTALGLIGLVMGSYVVEVSDPMIILSTGFGTAFAAFLSGFVGTYLMERAERLRELHELERSMLVSLENSLLERAQKTASLLIALASGVAALFASAVILSPFAFAYLGLCSIKVAYFWALAQGLLFLFILGFFMGRISRENKILYGILAMFLGLLIALLGLFIE